MAKKRKQYSKATVVKKTRQHKKEGLWPHHAAQAAGREELQRASGPVTKAGIKRTEKLDALKADKQKSTPKKAKSRRQGPKP